MVKPKRIGTYVIDYSRFGDPEADRHPVYEYRGLYIVRNAGVAHGKSYHYSIYRSFDGKRPTDFDFNMNIDRGFRKLEYAARAVDRQLSRRSL